MNDLLSKIGWSQAFFARHIGVTEKTVGRWCQKNPNPVAMKYLELVTKLVGV